MKQLHRDPFPVFHLMLFLVAFAGMLMLASCEKDDNPAADPACGSGRTTWDEKAQICRDLADSHVVPNSCCGR